MPPHCQRQLNLTHWSFHPDQGALWPGFQVQKPVLKKNPTPAWWADSVLHLEGMELVAAAKPLTPKWVTSAYRAHSKSCWSKPENLFSGSEVEQPEPSEQCEKPAAVCGGGGLRRSVLKNKTKQMCRVDFWRAGSADAHLHDGDDGNEDGRRAQAVLVEVPAPVRLAGQDLVGHVADEALVQAQPRLVQEDLPLQRAPAIGDGPSEAAGALAAHLRGRKEEKSRLASRALASKLTQQHLAMRMRRSSACAVVSTFSSQQEGCRVQFSALLCGVFTQNRI